MSSLCRGAAVIGSEDVTQVCSTFANLPRILDAATLPVGLPVRKSPVSSSNEWDPLEEVIVGVIDGAAVPPWHPALEATMPKQQHDFYRRAGGERFPTDQIKRAAEELDRFAELLRSD